MTDGTAAGTRPVVPDLTASGPANPDSLTAFQGALYFYAQSGDPTAWGLWRSDGTAAGTRLLKAVDRPHPVLIGVSDSSPEPHPRRRASSSSGPTTASTASSCGRPTAPRKAPCW